MSRVWKILLPILILGIGFGSSVALVRSKSEVPRRSVDPPVPLVRVTSIERRDVPIVIRARGVVLPRTETTLSAQVAAEVVEVSPTFEVGGFVERGQILARLDRRDFALALELAKSKVAQARLRLTRQLAEASVARDEWSALGQGQPDPLVVRQPQVDEARAALTAAEAELAGARLGLERTTIRAPFAGRIRQKAVEIGQFLRPGERVASLHAVDFVEVRLPVSHHEVPFLDPRLLAGEPTADLPAVELSASFSERQHRWYGWIVRAEGEIDAGSHMLHLVARVEDPYGRRSESPAPPLVVGLFVEARIWGPVVEDAVLLPRSALRDGSQVLVVDAGDRLRFRTVEILRTQDDVVFVQDPFQDGERLCVSATVAGVEGQPVQTLAVEAPRLNAAPPPELADLADTARRSDPNPARPPQRPGRLISISPQPDAEGEAFRILIDGSFTYSHFFLPDPQRAILDLRGVLADAAWRLDLDTGGAVRRIRSAQFKAHPQPVTRVVFDLSDTPSPLLIEEALSGLLIRFDD